MRYQWLLPCVLFMITITQQSFAEESQPLSIQKPGPTTEISLSEGWRHDRFSWNIAGPNKKPNVISELTWKDLKTWYTRVGTKITSDEGMFLKAHIGHGIIYHGKNQDSDYNRNNRKGEFSRTIHKATGRMYDANIMVGQELWISSDSSISPQIGYGILSQKFRNTKGRVVKGYPGIFKKLAERDFSKNLNTTYRATWHGPQLGLGAKYKISQELDLFGQYTVFFPVQYQGKGHWNLRNLKFKDKTPLFKSFGQTMSFGSEYHFSRNLSLRGEFEISSYIAKDGKETSYHTSTPSRKIKQPFNKAKLTSLFPRIGLVYKF